MQEDSLVNIITTKKRVWDQLRRSDCKAFARLLPDRTLRQAAKESGLAWGRGPLHVGTLVWLGLCSTVNLTRSFAGILVLFIKMLHDLPQAATGKRRPGKRARAADQVSEEAFVQARRKLPTPFWNALLNLLVEEFERQHARHAAWKEFRLLALDGTTLSLPHWKRLRDHFGSASNGRGQRRTQARLVMLQLPQTRLPWRYALTPLSQGERTVAKSLLQGLRPRDLVLMEMRPSLLCASVQYAQSVLLPRLLERIGAHRVPLRPGRHFPRPRDTETKNKGNNRHQKPSKIGVSP